MDFQFKSISVEIEHIGIAVEDLGKSEALFEKLLGVKPYKKENVQTEGVTTSFFKIADQKLELLHAISENSPIKKFIDKRNIRIHASNDQSTSRFMCL